MVGPPGAARKRRIEWEAFTEKTSHLYDVVDPTRCGFMIFEYSPTWVDPYPVTCHRGASGYVLNFIILEACHMYSRQFLTLDEFEMNLSGWVPNVNMHRLANTSTAFWLDTQDLSFESAHVDPSHISFKERDHRPHLLPGTPIVPLSLIHI